MREQVELKGCRRRGAAIWPRGTRYNDQRCGWGGVWRPRPPLPKVKHHPLSFHSPGLRRAEASAQATRRDMAKKRRPDRKETPGYFLACSLDDQGNSNPAMVGRRFSSRLGSRLETVPMTRRRVAQRRPGRVLCLQSRCVSNPLPFHLLLPTTSRHVSTCCPLVGYRYQVAP